VRLTATLTPEQLGGSTTIGFTLRIPAAAGTVPPPLTEVDLRYPQDLGIAASGLGLGVCAPALLEVGRPEDCPSNSVMGTGRVFAELYVGPKIVHERAHLTIFRAPTKKGRIAMVFYANGAAPVAAQLLLPSLLLPAPAPFGGRLKIAVPLVPGFPETPDVAVVRLTATLGSMGVTYYEREHGRIVAYHPRSLQLPDKCPRGGFPLAAELAFGNGSSATARTTVACPGARRRRGGHTPTS
jgi:hypothetical protein